MDIQSASSAYEAESQYRVELSRVARFDGLRLRGEITLTGEAVDRLILQEGADIIVSAVKL